MMGELSRRRRRGADRNVTMGKNKWMNLLMSVGMCAGVLCVCLTGCGKAADDGAASNQDAAADEQQGAEEAVDGQEGVDAEMEERDGLNVENGTEQQDAEEDGGEPVSLEGLGLSILGDSISTYDGWIPEGYNVFYPFDGELTDVSQTWWKGLMEDTGMELCANNSSSGSTCAGDSLCVDNPSYGCSEGRLSLLYGSQGRLPDIIIIYMGTNDLLTGMPIGDNDGTQLVEEGDIENFSDAYCLMLDKLASYYPTAQIYCCSLTQVGDWGTDQPFVMFENHLGLTAQDYTEQIRLIAENKGAPVIDLYHCGVEIDNLQEMTTDGVHLTPVGMEHVKKAVLDGLTGKAGR